ncbi:hypothetical protein Y032_0603g538 [Ancylostoma ceylanicum]|uniref:Uncharacterized protein n=1 Tax=Ancylostoma ceylanicum TaxID=53326 RepID=A0A016WLY7_9BILA|nr:hypothetical protein Y032_0603g538 [Ancylostoma ceylanicum]
MGWKLGLAMVFLAASCCADESPESTLTTQDNQSEDYESSDADENVLKNRSTITNQSKVTQTVGSMLPPNPDLIVNLTPNDDNGAVKESERKRAELELLKKSSKFRNAALGAPITKTKLDEVEIQNIDGANPHLPPFAFSGDDADTKAKSAREIKQPDESPPKTTPATPTTTGFEQAKLIETLEDINSGGFVEEERAKRVGTGSPDGEPTAHVQESVDTVVESDTTIAPSAVVTNTEVVDPIAEYNRKIVELAKRRRMIKEEGYKKYKQIMFKSGRNIVPVRLFFDTDPALPLQPEDSFKRSIKTPSETAKGSPVQGDKHNLVDAAVGGEKRQEVQKVEISKPNPQLETRKALLVDSASFTPSAVNIVETTTLLNADQVLLNGQTESAPEDLAGSGLPPPTTSESTIEVQEELLSQQAHHAAEVVSVQRQTSTPFALDLSSTTTEDITRFDKMVKVEPAVMASTPSPTEPLSEVSSQRSEESTTERSVSEITSEILDMLGESTTPILPTSSQQLLEPSSSIPVFSEAASSTALTANLSQTLPPLLSMPPLSALSSFSSLNTPVKIATQPRKPKKTSSERVGDDRKKSSGILGLKTPLPTKKPRRKLTKLRTSTVPFDVVDSEGRTGITSTGTRAVTPAERHRFIKQKPGASPVFSKPDRFGVIRKGIRVNRPIRHRAVLVGQTSSPALISRTHPGQRIFERTVKVDKPRRRRVRTKLQRRNPNILTIRQRGSATDLRSSFATTEAKSSVPLVITSPIPPRSPPVLSRLSIRPHAVNRHPTFGASHQQAPAVQLSLRPSGVSMARGPQSLIQPQPSLARTLASPLNPVGELKVVKPKKNNIFRLSEWDRIREEFLRIKRQHKKLRQKHRQARARAASGGKTLSSERPNTAAARENTRYVPHNGEIARGVVWREVEASKDPRALRVDVDPSRRTIDRDAIVNL